MAYFDGVIGNSSSGILEVPSFKKSTVNIGDRQKGRIMTKSIINCECSSESIKGAIKKSLSPEFREQIKNVKNPYEQRGSVSKIVKIIENINLTDILVKRFYDLKLSAH